MPIPLRGCLHTRRSASLAFPSRNPVPRVTGRRWQATESVTAAEENPPPAGGQNAKIGDSRLLRGTRDLALQTPGIIWADENAGSTGLVVGKQTQKMNMYHAVRDALHTALSKDETAAVFGEDVSFGGVFRCTVGLAQEFGRERVFNTPLTEQGIVGFGIGLASMGHTAIAEIQFSDYIFPAFDQLVNEAAKFRYRSGGQHNCGGLTIRSPCMAVGHGGLYHSQSPEGFFLGAHGLKIVIPRSPIQAKGLLLASIRERCPTLFFEPKILYRSAVEQVMVDEYTLPLSKIETLLPGSDLTVISYGTPIYTCEAAISLLNAPPPELDREDLVPKGVRGAKIELIDLRTIVPWDMEGVMESVKRTGRLVIVHEAGRTGGVGAEIATEVQKRLFLRLEAPVKIVAGWDTPVGLAYEKFYIPDAIRVLDALVETLKY